jgi:hypothetical protein
MLVGNQTPKKHKQCIPECKIKITKSNQGRERYYTEEEIVCV